MSGVPETDLFRLGPWPEGIDNVHAETDLPSDDKGRIVALREAVNIDINDGGKVSSREGYRETFACTRGHSLWHDGQFPYALFVDVDTLYATNFADRIPLVAGLAALPLSYRLVNERVYWSNGRQNGVIYSDLTTAPWGVETPLGQPTLGVTAGALFAGRYQVAVTFRSASGEEGGATVAALIDVSEGQGIGLSNIPQPAAANIITVRAYLSPANGDALYFARDLPVGMTSATLGQMPGGVPLQTQFLEPMPAGEIVEHLGGRMYAFAGNVMTWSEALRYGLAHRTKNRMRIGARITMAIAVGEGTDGAGLFVSDGVRTYWFSGPDPAQFNRKIAYSFAAIPGTQTSIPGSYFGLDTAQPVAYWIAENGVACLGLPGGVVTPLRESQVVAPGADSGATLLLERNGMRQAITALQGAVPRQFGVRDKAAATVYRNGVAIA